MSRKSYRAIELEHVPAVMLGGPVDGRRFRMPIIPGLGIPTAYSLALEQPHQTSRRAVYLRKGDSPVGGYYVYFFDEITDAHGVPMLHATPDAHQQYAGQL